MFCATNRVDGGSSRVWKWEDEGGHIDYVLAMDIDESERRPRFEDGGIAMGAGIVCLLGFVVYRIDPGMMTGCWRRFQGDATGEFQCTTLGQSSQNFDLLFERSSCKHRNSGYRNVRELEFLATLKAMSLWSPCTSTLYQV